MANRDYAKISIAIWQSRKFRGLKGDDSARLLYMYLHSCPQVNSVGCFTLPIGYVVTDLGWSEEDAARRLRDLKSAGLIDWDEGEEMIRICGFIDHDPPTNQKHAGSMVAVARSLHGGNLRQVVILDLRRQKHVIGYPDLIATLDSLSGQDVEPLALVRTVPIPVPNPVPHPHRPSLADKPAGDDDDGFDEFFREMPKQENRQDAQQAYKTVRMTIPTEILLAGAKRYAEACQGRKTKHISSPAVWLGKQRWTDGQSAPPPAMPETPTDPSWGDRAAELSAAIGEGNFRAFFADALVDFESDPPRLAARNGTKLRLIAQKFPKQLKTLFGGEFALEERV